MKNKLKMSSALTLLLTLILSVGAYSSTDLKVGDKAPLFELKTQAGENLSLESRRGMWTILYFYPKAGTPGCTDQACAFRDNIKKITALGADVYGVSINSVEEQAKFAKENNISFPLLADDKGEVTKLYGSKMPILKLSKRWTFIIDSNLIIRDIAKDVDPILDVKRVTDKIKELKN